MPIFFMFIINLPNVNRRFSSFGRRMERQTARGVDMPTKLIQPAKASPFVKPANIYDKR